VAAATVRPCESMNGQTMGTPTSPRGDTTRLRCAETQSAAGYGESPTACDNMIPGLCGYTLTWSIQVWGDPCVELFERSARATSGLDRANCQTPRTSFPPQDTRMTPVWAASGTAGIVGEADGVVAGGTDTKVGATDTRVGATDTLAGEHPKAQAAAARAKSNRNVRAQLFVSILKPSLSTAVGRVTPNGFQVRRG
jgi:hypothetical protein